MLTNEEQDTENRAAKHNDGPYWVQLSRAQAIEGDTFSALRDALQKAGYEGRMLQVRDASDLQVGWCNHVSFAWEFHG